MRRVARELRSCFRWSGRQKRNYLGDGGYDQAKIDAVILTERSGSEYGVYDCDRCGGIHIGRWHDYYAKRRSPMRDFEMDRLEQGDRAGNHMRMENTQSEEDRLRHVMKTLKSAQRRSLAIRSGS